MIGWIQFSRAEIKRAEDALKSGEMGVRDEIGFLILHQSFSDHFFPGTSVLHTRLRYALFVPWLMQASGGDAQKLARYELDLTGQLNVGTKNERRPGVIGGDIYPRAPAQSAAMAYWSAMSRWGILRPRANGTSLSRAQTLKVLNEVMHQKKGPRHEEDSEYLQSQTLSPFISSLPDAPADFLKSGVPLTFNMSKHERVFMRRQLSTVWHTQTGQPSLLAKLVENNAMALPEYPWHQSIYGIADKQDVPLLAMAEQTAALSCIGRAVYAALVEELRAKVLKDTPNRHRRWLEQVKVEYANPALQLDLDKLWKRFPHQPQYLYDLLQETQRWLLNASSVTRLRDTYTKVEVHRKGARARLSSPDNVGGQRRRAEWKSEDHSLAEPLHYRWGNVCRLLADLES